MTDAKLRQHRAAVQRERRKRLKIAGWRRIDLNLQQTTLDLLAPYLSSEFASLAYSLTDFLERLAEGKLPVIAPRQPITGIQK